MNPLTEIKFKVPFDQAEAAHVEPAIDEWLAYAMSVVQHIESVATTPAFRAAYNAVQPKVSAFYSSIPLNEGLWKALQKYAATEEGRTLKGTYRRFLTKEIDSFKRHGADLDAA